MTQVAERRRMCEVIVALPMAHDASLYREDAAEQQAVSQQIGASTADGAVVADPALDAVRALVAATARPVGVFDADGACLTANRAFVLHATRHARAPAGSEGRTAFSPDGLRTWTLVSVPEEGAEPRSPTSSTPSPTRCR
jgi:hypothetical protein